MEIKDCHLLHLPTELMLLVIDEISQQYDLAALARTCRQLQGLVTPILYENEVNKNDWRVVFWAAERGRVGTLKQWVAVQNSDGNIRASLDIYTATKAIPQTDDLSIQDIGIPGPLWRDKYFVGPLATATLGRHMRCYAPLHHAAGNGHKDVVEFLLDHGADINAGGVGILPAGISVFHDARDRNHPLHENRIMLNALHIAVISNHDPAGYADVAKVLLQRGIDPVLRPLQVGQDSNITALHLAAAYSHLPGNLEVLRIIAESGRVDINGPDIDGQTPLMYAAESNGKDPSLAVFATLKKLGADIDGNVSTSDGIEAPLLVALIRRNRWRAAARLIDVGVRLEVQEGQRPLLEEVKRAKMSVIHPEKVDSEAYAELVKRLERQTRPRPEPEVIDSNKPQNFLKRVANLVLR